MSKTFKVSTLEKKSIGTTETFEKVVDGVTYRADLEHWYRWGYVILSGVENQEDLTQHDPLEVTGYDIEDQDFDDGVAAYWHFSDNVTDEMKEEVQTLWDEEGYSGLEENDWSHVDVETYFHGPLEVELISEEPDEEDRTGETVAPKSAWPF